MSSIVKMYDASNNDVYPITHLRAVRDSNGTTLESMIQGVNETTVGYYECNTAGSTPEKAITIDSSVSLSVRISCKVKFAEKNTGANATMNINNTGAKPLFYNGVRAAANNSWYTNEIVDLYFDGTNYQAKSCADTLEYDVSLHQTHEITEVTTTTRTVVYNGDVTSGWENETSVSDSSVNGYTRTETNTGKDNDATTVDVPTAKYDTASNKTSVVYVTKRTLTHVVNDYTFDEAVNAVPMSYRHGGLKLRFISNSNGSVQNSDNKYMQYRLMSDEWSTTESDWQNFNPIQQKGQSTTVVMSQKAVTDELNALDEKLTATTEYLLGSEYNPKLLGNFYVLNGVITAQSAQTCKYFKVFKGQKFGIVFSSTTNLNIRWGFFNDVPEVGSTAIKYENNFKNGNTLVAPSDGYFAFSYAYSLVESISIIPYSKIEEIDAEIDDIVEIAGIAKRPIEMLSGYYYGLGNLNVGDTFNENEGRNSSYKNAKVKCKAGDKFTLNASAGSVAGLYCFVDSNDVVLNIRGSATVTDLVVIAPTGAVYCYLNDSSNSTSYFERDGKYANTEQEIKRIDSKNHFNGLSSDFSLSASASKTLSTIYVRKNSKLSLDVGSFTSLRFGLGYQAYMGYWIEINSTTVSVYRYVSSEALITSYEHGLDISSGIRASIVAAEETASIILVDAFGTVSKTDNINWWGGGAAFVTNLGNNTIVGNVAYIPGDITKKIWMFGDSYFSYNQNARWLHYMIEWNFKNWLANHLPGINSVNSITAFDNLKNLAIPTYIVWGLGMNDNADSDANTPSSTWLSSVEHIIEYCKHNAIEPILCTIPSVPTKLHEGKNNWIRNSGYRYIDFAKAVNAQADGTWAVGLISGDGVHPTAAGAKVLASQVLIDFPEIMVE